jgi:peptidyl-prolyl cis-trans isomerase A (cyclophilin A)
VKRELAPVGADRFYRLVKERYYDDIRAFRVVPGFVAQFGMSGDPATNANWDKATIPDDPVKTSNKKGTITFATSGPDSRTTQLFINLEDNAGLDRQGFSPFGAVTEGMENVEKFYTGYGERPDQGEIAAAGNQYLDRQFPKLTKIKTARVVSENGKPVKEKAE